MIKAIIFDVGGVLIDHAWPGMIEHFIQTLKTDKEDLYQTMLEYIDDWQRAKISEKVFWERVCKKLHIDPPKTESLWHEGFKHAYKEKSEIFNLIQKLKNKGYKIGLLSNAEAPVMEFIIEKKYQHFDVSVFSCGTNMAKPDKEIYQHVLEKLHVKPEEAIFIDDAEENVAGANRVGMTGILFSSTKQIENLLESLL
jgi:putative hydrolase of the HAD superfamily